MPVSEQDQLVVYSTCILSLYAPYLLVDKTNKLNILHLFGIMCTFPIGEQNQPVVYST